MTCRTSQQGGNGPDDDVQRELYVRPSFWNVNGIRTLLLFFSYLVGMYVSQLNLHWNFGDIVNDVGNKMQGKKGQRLSFRDNGL